MLRRKEQILRYRKLIFGWFRDWCEPSERNEILDILSEKAFGRLKFLTYLLFIAYPIYGLYTYPYLSQFWPNMSVLDNVVPRVMVNSLFLLVLFKLLSASKKSYFFKCILGLVIHYGVFSIACWIWVWPTTLLKNAVDILPIVNFANCLVMTVVIVGMSPPTILTLYSIGLSFVFLWVPFLLIAYFTVEPSVFIIQINDILSWSIISIGLSSRANYSQSKLVRQKLKARSKSKILYGERTTRIIFEGNEDFFKKRYRKGFLANLDIRSFNDRIKNVLSQEDLKLFLHSFQAITRRMIEKYSGDELKCVGDEFLVFFGNDNSFKREVTFSDKPGFEHCNKLAQSDQFKYSFERTIDFCEELSLKLYTLADEYKINVVNVGIGVTFGEELFEVIGGRYDLHMELPTRAKRLQEYTKFFYEHQNQSSIIIFDEKILKIGRFDSKLQQRQYKRHKTYGQVRNFGPNSSESIELIRYKLIHKADSLSK